MIDERGVAKHDTQRRRSDIQRQVDRMIRFHNEILKGREQTGSRNPLPVRKLQLPKRATSGGSVRWCHRLHPLTWRRGLRLVWMSQYHHVRSTVFAMRQQNINKR